MLGPFIGRPSPYSDGWEDQPTQGPFFQWGLGVVLPLIILVWGIHAIVAKTALWTGENADMTLGGVNAVAIGSTTVSAAIFLHCHYFWGNVYNQAWFAVLGKIAGAAGFIVAIGIVIVRVGVLGRN